MSFLVLPPFTFFISFAWLPMISFFLVCLCVQPVLVRDDVCGEVLRRVDFFDNSVLLKTLVEQYGADIFFKDEKVCGGGVGRL